MIPNAPAEKEVESPVAIDAPLSPPVGSSISQAAAADKKEEENFPFIFHQKHGVLRAAVVNFDAALLPRRKPTPEVVEKVVRRHLTAAMRECSQHPGQRSLALILAAQPSVVEAARSLAGDHVNAYYVFDIGAPEDDLTLYAALVAKPLPIPSLGGSKPSPRRGLISDEETAEAFRRLYEHGAA